MQTIFLKMEWRHLSPVFCVWARWRNSRFRTMFFKSGVYIFFPGSRWYRNKGWINRNLSGSPQMGIKLPVKQGRWLASKNQMWKMAIYDILWFIKPDLGCVGSNMQQSLHWPCVSWLCLTYMAQVRVGVWMMSRRPLWISRTFFLRHYLLFSNFIY